MKRPRGEASGRRRHDGRRRLRPYSRPRLERLGDLRGLTLGGSPGIPDSGGGMQPQIPQP